MAGSLRHLASPYQRYRHAQALHALRVALAMLTTILITSGLHLPHGDWASVSMLIVIGGIQHHGNIRKKATERALGTMLGAGLGLLFIVVHAAFGSAWLTYGLLSLTAGVCAYYAIGRAGYIALLTAITVIIVAGHGDNSLQTGMWRSLNVFIGIVVALVFSFALPLNATYSWRYDMALNLRRSAGLIRRLLAGEILTPEARNAVFVDLTRRSISLRNLLASVAKETEAPMRQLEEIQTLHRSILASLETMSTVRFAGDSAQPVAVMQAFQEEGRSMRAMLLAMARALRAGDPSTLQPYAADALMPGPTPEVAAKVLPPEAQGPYWFMRQSMAQVDRLLHLLLTLRGSLR